MIPMSSSRIKMTVKDGTGWMFIMKLMSKLASTESKGSGQDLSTIMITFSGQ